MMLEPLQYLLGAGSGVLVGFILGLIGGGGSVLAVPLMVYLAACRTGIFGRALECSFAAGRY
jgi:uncharacterized membrane protein YfcA